MSKGNNLNVYELSRSWFNYSFENPNSVKPIHTAIYFFAVEHCNRLGWKVEFGFPTTMVMEAIGVKSYNTYIKALNELVEFGFILMIEKSKNQYSSNIIALSKNNEAHDKALDKALIKHTSKQSESTVQSIDSIIKQIYNRQYTSLQLTSLRHTIDKFIADDDTEQQEVEDKGTKLSIDDYIERYIANDGLCKAIMNDPKNNVTDVSQFEGLLKSFNDNLKQIDKGKVTWNEYVKHFRFWLPKRPQEEMAPPPPTPQRELTEEEKIQKQISDLIEADERICSTTKMTIEQAYLELRVKYQGHFKPLESKVLDYTGLDYDKLNDQAREIIKNKGVK